MVRQPTQSQKFLILAGPARSAEFLQNARVEVEKDKVKALGGGHTVEEAQTHEVHCVGNKHVGFNEHSNLKEDSMVEEDEVTDTKRDDQDEEDGKEQESDEDETCQYKKWVKKEGMPDTRPVRGDEVMVNYTSILSDGSRMDNTYKHEPYSFIIGATPTTKGFEKAILSMNLHEKAHFEISHKWMYGKAGIPTNVPPDTDFTFDIHFIKNKKQNKDEKITDQVAVKESEASLQVEPEQEWSNGGVIYRVADMAMVDIAMTAATRPQEELSRPPIQPNPQLIKAHHKILPFLAKGPQTKHKT